MQGARDDIQGSEESKNVLSLFVGTLELGTCARNASEKPRLQTKLHRKPLRQSPHSHQGPPNLPLPCMSFPCLARPNLRPKRQVSPQLDQACRTRPTTIPRSHHRILAGVLSSFDKVAAAVVWSSSLSCNYASLQAVFIMLFHVRIWKFLVNFTPPDQVSHPDLPQEAWSYGIQVSMWAQLLRATPIC